MHPRAPSNLRGVLAGVPFVVVGGVAAGAYAEPRFTKDTDVLIRGSDGAAVERALTAEGATVVGPLEFSGTLGLRGTTWTLRGEESLDVLTSDQAWAREAVGSPAREVNGLPVVSLPFLVLMKLAASRSMDLGDVERMLGQAGDDELAAVRRTVQRFRSDLVEDLTSIIELARLAVGPTRAEATADAPTPGADRGGVEAAAQADDGVHVEPYERRGKTVKGYRRRRPSAGK